MSKFYLQKRFKKAFTLAEVLITLGIIGIVAQMTIPTLTSNIQKQIYIAGLQKAYSGIMQGFNAAVSDNGEISQWDWGPDFSQSNNTTVLAKYLIPYFAVIQDCGYTTTGDCTRTAKYYLNNTTIFSAYYMITLKDGSQFLLALDGVGTPSLIDIWVDTNGNKKPNIMGKDIFFMAMSVYAKKPYLYGQGSDRATLLNDSTYGCNPANAGRAGLYCGTLIQQDGWQIKSDYPW